MSTGAVVKVGVLTISDRCSQGLADDVSGATLVGLVAAEDMMVAEKELVSDDVSKIQEVLVRWCDKEYLDVVITTGGTGFTDRDVTPEACATVFEKEAPGISVALTMVGLKATPMAMLSRLRAGIRKRTLIVNFPGSAKACKESFACLAPIIKHCVDQLRGNKKQVDEKHSEMKTDGSQPLKSQVKHIPPAYRSRTSPYAMVSIDSALTTILKESSQNYSTEHVSIKFPERLIGRIACHDILAAVPIPPFPASIKDGYAVIADDKAGTRHVSPLASTAGISPDEIGLISGFCVRINTGAPLPRGADAVVQVEDTELLECSETGEELKISIRKEPTVGQDIRKVGSDIKSGECIIEKGTQLGPIEIGLVAAVGLRTIEVYKAPVIGLLSTGDEIIPAGEELTQSGQIWDSNKTTLLALFKQQNFAAIDLGIAKDNADDVFARIAKGFDEVDILVSTGGVSMGEKDLLKRILVEDFGATIHFGRVNLKPGKPTAFCTCQWKGSKKLVFALPGNPTSATVTSLLFVLPALRHVSGVHFGGNSENVDSKVYKTIKVKLELENTLKLDERPEYVRAVVTFDSNGSRAQLIRGSQRSSRLMSMKDANALVVLPVATSDLREVGSDLFVDAILF